MWLRRRFSFSVNFPFIRSFVAGSLIFMWFRFASGKYYAESVQWWSWVVATRNWQRKVWEVCGKALKTHRQVFCMFRRSVFTMSRTPRKVLILSFDFKHSFSLFLQSFAHSLHISFVFSSFTTCRLRVNCVCNNNRISTKKNNKTKCFTTSFTSIRERTSTRIKK